MESLWFGDGIQPLVPSKKRPGLLDEMDELEKKRKEGKKKPKEDEDGLDLDGVWS